MAQPGRGITLPSVEFGVGKPWHVKFNPKVTGAAVVAIWTFIIYTLVSPAQASKEWAVWFDWVGDEWTWFYMSSQNIWLGVIFYLMLTKYGNLKFGGPDTEPEFSKLQWFGMMYTCGVAVGLFYWGVAEPLSHFNSGRNVPVDRRLEAHPGVADGATDDWSIRSANMNDNERANYALMQVFFHWGIHGWIPYVLIGALMALLSYRRGLPMTMRTCFYPLWGKGIEGWRGDIVDVLSIMCTLFGVCTSLGMGVRQLNTGLIRLDRGTYMGKDYYGSNYASTAGRSAVCGERADGDCRKGKIGIEFNVKTQCWIVFFVTLLATCSVALGLKRGIAVLSYVAFAMGMLLVTSVLFMDDTMYILDAITTSFGYYLWYLPKIAWECDAWARLNGDRSWTGNAMSGGMAKDSSAVGPVDGLGAGAEWHSGWTVFYWGWWISWGPFVGTFLAKISKGRTLREFIIWALILPTLYCVLWFGTFGGAAIGMQMRSDHIDSGTKYWGKDAARPLDTRMAGFADAEHNRAYVVDLSSGTIEDKFFDLLGSYGGKGLAYGITGFAWLCLLSYFITSSDSGSLVIDMISANGDQDPPLAQRIFWACTEGAAAIALLKGSGGDPDRALDGVSAVSVVCGLPFTVVLMYMCHALYLACLEEAGDLDENRPAFRTTLLALPQADKVGEWVKSVAIAAVAPFVPIRNVLSQVEGSTGKASDVLSKDKMVLFYTGLSAVFIYFGSILLIFSMWEANLRMVAGALYLAFATIVAYTRYMTRTGLGIQFGDALTDVCVSVLFYPLVLAQCEEECNIGTVSGGSVSKTVEA
jgi:choline-glycine betaine transporter